jgi:hypothetical protein
MKALALVILVWFLPVIQSTAADSRISDIRAEYQAIRSALPTLKEENISLFGYSTEGGEAKAYRDAKGNLRYMRVEFYGEMGKAIEEYYVRNGRLIFMYRGLHRYNVPFYLTPERAKEIGSDPFDPEKTTLAEERYYFHDSKMIRWIDTDKKEVSPDSIDFKKAETEVLNSFREFVSKIK